MGMMNGTQTYAPDPKGVVSTRRPTFAVVTGGLILVGFVQLIMLGLALAGRVGETRVVELEKDADVKLVYIPTLADDVPEADDVKPRSYEDLLENYGKNSASIGDYKLPEVQQQPQKQFSPGFGIRPSASFDSGRFPSIKNSRVEKLVEEAKDLHLEGDVVRAILKLEEADVFDSSQRLFTVEH